MTVVAIVFVSALLFCVFKFERKKKLFLFLVVVVCPCPQLGLLSLCHVVPCKVATILSLLGYK